MNNLKPENNNKKKLKSDFNHTIKLILDLLIQHQLKWDEVIINRDQSKIMVKCDGDTDIYLLYQLIEHVKDWNLKPAKLNNKIKVELTI